MRSYLQDRRAPVVREMTERAAMARTYCLRHRRRDAASAQRVERLLEAAGMRLLGLRQGLEPIGDLVETFLARGPRHAGIHVGVFVRLAGDRRLEVARRRTDRQTGRGIADFLEELEMTVRMAGLALGGR